MAYIVAANSSGIFSCIRQGETANVFELI